MRLINTHTRQFEEFFGSNIPEYAILSHTWEAEEITYKRYIDRDCEDLKGFDKIDRTCHMAKTNNIDYAWIDTCCIDKSSSAELSEAINSMFCWYQQAKVCYVYLSDLLPAVEWREGLHKCRWFTRGWTLQELIAPHDIIFYNSCWQTNLRPGGSTKSNLVSEISRITKIDRELLDNTRPLRSFCVAQKLSWASCRETTRVEDMAYCLLGILGLNMPLLYGEGEKAFRRLQEEFIRSSPDFSILAWKMTHLDRLLERDTVIHSEDRSLISSDHSDPLLGGIFAQSPAEFIDCGGYERSFHDDAREFSASNIGIKIRARLLLLAQGEKGPHIYILPLYCSSHDVKLGLELRQVGRQHYLRRDPKHIVQYDPRALLSQAPQEIFLLSSLPHLHRWPYDRFAPMKHVVNTIHRHKLSIVVDPDLQTWSAWPPDSYDPEGQFFFITEDPTRDFNTINITWTNSEWGLIHCKIIALNWSDTNTTEAQFSIVCNTSYEESLHRFQKLTAEFDRPPENLQAEFDAACIPQTNLFVGESGFFQRVTAISIVPTKLLASSGRSHYQIKVRCDIIHPWDVPNIEPCTWVGAGTPDASFDPAKWQPPMASGRGGYN